MIKDRIEALRREMKKRGIDIYYVPTSDFHDTEYVGEYFKARQYITGFTGSAGFAVITEDEAGLWTDGRYFVQAEAQLRGTPVKLFRMNEENVPPVRKYIADKSKSGTVIGFDGRVVNQSWMTDLLKLLKDKKVSFHTDEDLIDIIWKDRPERVCTPVELLDVKYSGCSTDDKLKAVREDMEKNSADAHVLSKLDDICWLFNIRGNDISHFPVVMSYAVILKESAYLFVNPSSVDTEVTKALMQSGVTVCVYDKFFDELPKLVKDRSVLLDSSVVSMRLYEIVSKCARIVDLPNPEVLRKSIKNETELRNIRNAHIKDGIACTKFMYWLKKNYNKQSMTELSAQEYLYKLRSEQEGFLDLSFDTICAFGPNAAMMHYEATPENYSDIGTGSFLLVDSGGHYKEGSTDITRTFVLGDITSEQKKMYTAVLKGNMNLANARFLHGCRGVNLDYLARGPLWEMGLDYRCGTGHGVGYRLNIHEAPNGFRWRVVEDRNDSCVLEEGMVTTNEPGYYEDGAYGIRIENEMICVKGPKTEYGQFMEFETITYCPIDLDGVDISMLTDIDRSRINAYHRLVREKLSPYFTGDELEFLKTSTREI